MLAEPNGPNASPGMGISSSAENVCWKVTPTAVTLILAVTSSPHVLSFTFSPIGLPKNVVEQEIDVQSELRNLQPMMSGQAET